MRAVPADGLCRSRPPPRIELSLVAVLFHPREVTMRHFVMIALLLVLGGCSDAPAIVGVQGGAQVSLAPAPMAAVWSDPYYIAAPYADLGVFDSLGTSSEAFGADPETITDSAFVAVGSAIVDSSEAGLYEGDALEVEEGVNLILLHGGGGGGGGGEPEMQSYSDEDDTVEPEGYCEQQYNRLASRCRRLGLRKARALCYAAAMGRYAACRAAQ